MRQLVGTSDRYSTALEPFRQGAERNHILQRASGSGRGLHLHETDFAAASVLASEIVPVDDNAAAKQHADENVDEARRIQPVTELRFPDCRGDGVILD